ncbi:MAG: nucleoside-diphosphate kinase [Syntrophomonadaceae bacterium]|nr:nucleoside-diphosphate kinase [Syntrophomonadaceae bacterium]
MEKTFVMVKPDGVMRQLTGKIIGYLEQKGFKLVALKMLILDQALAEQHYAEHVGKSFFPGLVDFITSGPVVAMVWEGPGVIKGVRELMGATNPAEALPGTIRGQFAVAISRNVIHGSDSPVSAEREIALYFKPEEILAYTRPTDIWLVE